MSDEAKVKVKLVFDDRAAEGAKKFTAEVKNATAGTEQVKNQAGEITNVMAGSKMDAAMKKFMSGSANAGASLKVGSMAASAMASAAMVAAGAFVAGGAAIAAGIVASTIQANEQFGNLKKTTMELISLSPEKNLSMEKAREGAIAFENEFRKISLTSGQARDSIREAFTVVHSQVGLKARLSLQDSEKIVRNMAMAARNIPGGLSTVSKEYQDMKGGIFSSNGALVQMVTTTGVLKGNAVDVAKQLASKDTITRMKLVEEAMARMAKSKVNLEGIEGFKKATSTIAQSMMESIGTPIVNRLLPIMGRVIDLFDKYDNEIQMTSTAVGNAVADVVHFGEGIVDQFSMTFAGRSMSVSQVIKESAEFVRNAFKYVYDNRETIANVFKAIGDTFKLVIDGLMSAGRFVGNTMAKFSDFMVRKFTDTKMDPKAARMFKEAEQMAQDPSKVASGAVEKQKKAAIAEAVDRGFEKQAIDWAAAVDTVTYKTEDSVQAFNDLANSVDPENAKLTARSAQAANQSVQQFVDQNTQDFIGAYNAALKAHDDGKLKYVASLVSGSTELQNALLKSADKFDGGAIAFAQRVGNEQFLKKVQDDAKARVGGSKAAPPQINFNGATFNIKQDFRDQDPDRVALVFRDDIAKAATARNQAMTQTPFGL